MKISSTGKKCGGRGFTLIELLIVVAIIAVLAGLLMAVAGTVQKKGRQARETSAGRQLIAGYLAAAADNDGQLMPAYYEGSAPELDGLNLKGASGAPVTSAELGRYPYRLLAYLKTGPQGTMLVSQNGEQIRKAFASSMYDYAVSLCPSFGINYYFVGGYKVDGVVQGESDCATRLSQVEKPASLLVFATAFTDVENQRVEGRFGVEPPSYRSALWDQNLHVDPRYGNKALCVFLDGSVRSYSVDELRDMRLWSKNAASADNKNYTVAATGSTGIGGGGGRR